MVSIQTQLQVEQREIHSKRKSSTVKRINEL